MHNPINSLASAVNLGYIRGMDTKTAIEKAGSIQELSKLLGISRQAVYQWGEKVPDSRVWQLKVLKPEWFV